MREGESCDGARVAPVARPTPGAESLLLGLHGARQPLRQEPLAALVVEPLRRLRLELAGDDGDESVHPEARLAGHVPAHRLDEVPVDELVEVAGPGVETREGLGDPPRPLGGGGQGQPLEERSRPVGQRLDRGEDARADVDVTRGQLVESCVLPLEAHPDVGQRERVVGGESGPDHHERQREVTAQVCDPAQLGRLGVGAGLAGQGGEQATGVGRIQGGDRHADRAGEGGQLAA